MGTVRIGGIVKASPSTQFWQEADWVRQDWGANFSVLGVWLRAANGPSGSGSSQYGGYGEQVTWWGGGELGRHAGTPFLPSGYAQNQTRWYDYWEHVFYHDANGFLGGIDFGMRLTYGSINEQHFGSIGAPPRIPKPPGAPTPVGLDEITATSMRYRFTGTTDGGATIREWQLGYGTDPNGPQFFVGSTGTSTVGGLTPATEWFFWSRGRNDMGWGPWSARISARTLAAAYVGKSGSFPPAAAVSVGKGGAFVQPQVLVAKGGAFVNAG